MQSEKGKSGGMRAADLVTAAALLVFAGAVLSIWFIMPAALESAQKEFNSSVGVMFGTVIYPIAYMTGGFCAAYVLQKWLKISMPKNVKIALLVISVLMVAAWVICLISQNANAYIFIISNQWIFMAMGIIVHLGIFKVQK